MQYPKLIRHPNPTNERKRREMRSVAIQSGAEIDSNPTSSSPLWETEFAVAIVDAEQEVNLSIH